MNDIRLAARRSLDRFLDVHARVWFPMVDLVDLGPQRRSRRVDTSPERSVDV